MPQSTTVLGDSGSFWRVHRYWVGWIQRVWISNVDSLQKWDLLCKKTSLAWGLRCKPRPSFVFPLLLECLILGVNSRGLMAMWLLAMALAQINNSVHTTGPNIPTSGPSLSKQGLKLPWKTQDPPIMFQKVISMVPALRQCPPASGSPRSSQSPSSPFDLPLTVPETLAQNQGQEQRV